MKSNIAIIARRKALVLFILTGLAFITLNTYSKVKPAAIFGDNMVLQRDIPVPVWGTAESGDKIVVEFAGQKQETTAGKYKKWSVKLKPLQSSCDNREMVILSTSVNGKKTKTVIKNILVGEVWFCSGQSNMRKDITKSNNHEKEISRANWPLIRYNGKGSKWQVCSPRDVANFSAVSYFFGRDLFKELNVPIGLINRSIGATAIQLWIPKQEVMNIPYARELVEKVSNPRVQDEVKEFIRENKIFRKKYKAWKSARCKGNIEVSKPIPPKRPKLFNQAINYEKRKIGGLYKSLVEPVIPYAIRGIIWYQGERNSGFAEDCYAYREMLPVLIKSWRKAWKEGDAPFFYVQLPNFRYKHWPITRESMLKCLTVKNTGMAVTIDIGEKNNIHPKNKQDVGKRLALIAFKRVYGKDIVGESPLYKSMKIEDSKIMISFKNIGSGLTAKGGTLKGFEIASADKEFHPAQADIKNNKVIVHSDKVRNPVAVRYAWKPDPDCNLYNKKGLPASPFRTDNWKLF